MKYWLIKSEPSEISIDDIQTEKTTEWWGIRNYQARNFMRDDMRVGDLAFFWHSSCKQPGIYGIVKIVTGAHPDSEQFKPESDYYDPKATEEKPRWHCVDIGYVKHTNYLSIKDLREYPELSDMKVLQKGNRLSIIPIAKEHWDFITKILAK